MATTRTPNRMSDDLFESSSMTFGQHLEELRKALAKATIWVGLGMIVGFFYADSVVQYIQTPLRAALRDFYLKQDKARLEELTGSPLPDQLVTWAQTHGLVSEEIFLDPAEMSLMQGAIAEHASARQAPVTQAPITQAPPQQAASEKAAPEKVSAEKTPTEKAAEGAAPTAGGAAGGGEGDAANESSKPTEAPKQGALEQGVIKQGSAASGGASQQATSAEVGVDDELSTARLPDEGLSGRLQAVRLWRKVSTRIDTLNIQEGFMIWLKAAMITGIVIGSPGIFWHIWHFVAAGLYPHERRYVFVFLPLSLTLFLSGVCLAFFVIFGLVIEFLLESNASLGTNISPRLNEYVSFALILPLGFGLAFQLPLVMVFMHRIGLFTVRNYLEKWRIAIFVIAFLSMILTPGGDVYSMLGMGGPLVLLYFFGIALCHYLPMGRGLGATGYDPA